MPFTSSLPSHKNLVLLFGEVNDRLMHGEIKFSGSFDELVLPPAQLFSFPGSYGAFINAQSFVGDYQIGIYTQTWLNPSQVGQAP